MNVDQFCTAYGVTPADMRSAAISAAFGYGRSQVPAALWAHWDGTTSRPTLMASLLASLGTKRYAGLYSKRSVRDFLWSILLPEEQALLALAKFSRGVAP